MLSFMTLNRGDELTKTDFPDSLRLPTQETRLVFLASKHSCMGKSLSLDTQTSLSQDTSSSSSRMLNGALVWQPSELKLVYVKE